MPITTKVTVQVRDWENHNDSEETTPYTDLTPYIALGGLKWQRADIDSSSAGRGTQDGLMHRARVSLKVRLDCSCRPLTSDEAKIVLTAIRPVWLQVKYLDPQAGGIQTKKMYSNNIPASFLFMRPDNTSYWEGIEFPLIEE